MGDNTIIEYVCPKCGGELTEMVIATLPPIYVSRCLHCGWEIEKKQQVIKIPYPYYNNYNTTAVNQNIPKNCVYCSNHPSNGGSGICHCILGGGLYV